jgi:acylphosphatase
MEARWSGGMTIRSVRLRISGRVQGVGFRAWARREALALGVAGRVRNLADGSVEALIEGDAAMVAVVIERCRRGPAYAEVREVTVEERAAEGLVGFEIVRGGF